MSGLTSSSFIVITLIPAMVLMIVPMPEYLAYCRPAWVPLVVIFWITQTEIQTVGLIFCWSVGFCMDVVLMDIFGKHALALLLMGMFSIPIRRRLSRSKRLEQMMLIFLFLVVFQVSTLWLDMIMHHNTPGFQWFFISVVSALIWPILSKGLKKWSVLYDE